MKVVRWENKGLLEIWVGKEPAVVWNLLGGEMNNQFLKGVGRFLGGEVALRYCEDFVCLNLLLFDILNCPLCKSFQVLKCV